MHQRRIAVAIWGAGFSGGSALGPVVGGLLLDRFGWGSVFLINVPLLVGIFVFGLIFLPEVKDEKPHPFDVISAALLLLTMLPVVYGLKTFTEKGLSFSALVGLFIGLISGFVFLRRQRNLTYPLLDLDLFRIRRFSVSIVANATCLAAFSGLLLIVPQYLQLVHNMDAFSAALLMIPSAVLGVLGALYAAQLGKRWRPSRAIAIGAFIAVVGSILFGFIEVSSPAFFAVAALGIANAGVSLAQTFANDLTVASAPKERNNAAMAISETAIELGVAMGIAVLGSALNVAYRAVIPNDVPNEAAQTLSNAVSVAQNLPPEPAHQLLTQAREAFITGLHLVGILAALTLTYAALQALWSLNEKKTLNTKNHDPKRAIPDPERAT